MHESEPKKRATLPERRYTNASQRSAPPRPRGGTRERAKEVRPSSDGRPIRNCCQPWATSVTFLVRTASSSVHYLHASAQFTCPRPGLAGSYKPDLLPVYNCASICFRKIKWHHQVAASFQFHVFDCSSWTSSLKTRARASPGAKCDTFERRAKKDFGQALVARHHFVTSSRCQKITLPLFHIESLPSSEVFCQQPRREIHLLGTNDKLFPFCLRK